MPQDDLYEQTMQAIVRGTSAQGRSNRRAQRIQDITQMPVEEIDQDPLQALYEFHKAWDQASPEEHVALEPAARHFLSRVNAVQNVEYTQDELAAMREHQAQATTGVGGFLTRAWGEGVGSIVDMVGTVAEMLGAEGIAPPGVVGKKLTRAVRGGEMEGAAVHEQTLRDAYVKALERESMGLPSGLDPELLESIKKDVADEGSALLSGKFWGQLAGFAVPATGLAKAAAIPLRGVTGGGLLAEALGFGAAGGLVTRDPTEILPSAAFGAAAGGVHRGFGALARRAGAGPGGAFVRGLGGGTGGARLGERAAGYAGRAAGSTAALTAGQMAAQGVRLKSPLEPLEHLPETALLGALFGIPGRQITPEARFRTRGGRRGRAEVYTEEPRLRGPGGEGERLPWFYFGEEAPRRPARATVMPAERRLGPGAERGEMVPFRPEAMPMREPRGRGVIELGERGPIPAERRIAPRERGAEVSVVRPTEPTKPTPGPREGVGPLQQAIEASPKVFPRGRQGKRYISDVWRSYREQTGQDISLPEFQRMLWEEHIKGKEGAVRLSRADLVEAMDPGKLRASEFQPREGARFHLVEPKARPSEGGRIEKRYSNFAGARFARVSIGGKTVDVRVRGPKDESLPNAWGDHYPFEETRAARIKAKAREMLGEKQGLKLPPRGKGPEAGFIDLQAIGSMLRGGVAIPARLISRLADEVWRRIGKAALRFGDVLRWLRQRFGKEGDRIARDLHDTIQTRYIGRGEEVPRIEAPKERLVPYGLHRELNLPEPVETLSMGYSRRKMKIGKVQTYSIGWYEKPLGEITAVIAEQAGKTRLAAQIRDDTARMLTESRLILGDLNTTGMATEALRRMGATFAPGGFVQATKGLTQQYRDYIGSRSLARMHEDPEVPGMFYARWQELMDGKRYSAPRDEYVLNRPPRPIPTEYEEPLIDLMRTVRNRAGQIMERIGIMQRRPDGTLVPFRHDPEGPMARPLQPDGIGVFLAGPGDPYYEYFRDEVLIRKNRWDRDHAWSYMESRRKAFQGSTEESTPYLWMELMREVEHFPAMIQPPGHHPVLMLAKTGAQAIKTYVRSVALRGAFRKVMGQEMPGKPTRWHRMRRDYPGTELAFFDRWVRGAQGMPIADPKVKPGNFLYEPWRWIQTAMAGAKVMMLTRAAIPNVPEVFLSKGTAFFGLHEGIKALRESYPGQDMGLEAIGSVTRDFMDLIYSNEGPWRIRAQELERIFAEITGRAFTHHFLNEYQEYIAARMADNIAKGWRERVYDRGELERHRAVLQTVFKFPEEVARRMIAGQATEGERIHFIQQAPPLLVGAKFSPLEASTLMNSRIFGFFYPFNTYASTITHTMATNLGGVIDAIKLRDPELALQSARLAVRNIATGSTQWLIGKALIIALGAGLVKGVELLLSEEEEKLRDRPLQHIGEVILDQSMLGPLASMIHGMKYTDSPLEGVITSSVPLRMINEILQAAAGKGRYRDMSEFEALLTFLEHPFAARREIRGFAAWVGLGSADRPLDSAISHFWGWKDRHYPDEYAKSKNKAYRIAMRRSRDEWRKKDGDPWPHLLDAVDAVITEDMHPMQARVKIAKAIRDRRILAQIPISQRMEYQRDAPGWVYERLEAHDKMLDELAMAFALGERERRL